jgi:hypothetical protein
MNKKNLILGGVLAVLIAGAYIYQGPWQNWRQESGKTKNFLSGLDVDGITAIKIEKFGTPTKLEKSENKWKIGGTKGFYVKDEKIGQALTALKDAAQAEMTLVSKNETMKPQFQTDNTTGAKITLMRGDETLANFILGKMSVDFTSTYLSPGGAETYSCAANIGYVLNQTDWYDKTIFSADKEKIGKIRFQYPGREFTIAIAEATADDKNTETVKKWEGILPYKFRVDAEKVGPILDIMSNLTAAEVPKQTFDNTGLEKHNIIIEATGEGFINNTLMVGDDNGAGLYYAKRGDSDNIYLITKEQRDALNKKSMDLR